MADLPKLPFVNSWVDSKTGRRYATFRSKETGRIPLPALDVAAFHKAYGDALELRDRLRAGTKPVDQDSFAWLVDAYLKSVEFRALADSTQDDYSKTCDLIKAELGDQPFAFTTRAMIKAVRDDYAATTRKANKIVVMLSCLYGWAQQEQKVPDGFNPAGGIKKLKRQGGPKEYSPWSEHELTAALADAPAHLLTPVLIALYTGQRRKDVREMTWQQVQGDNLLVRTSKTSALIDMPLHPALKVHLDRVRKEAKVVSLTGPICLNALGKPWPSDNALSGALRRFVEGHDRIPNDRSFHGLRYAAAARMEEGGSTVAGIEAVLGHRTFRMALKYASARKRAAEGVAAMKGTVDG